MSDDHALDPLMEGYLSYLADVSRKSPRTVVDVRCTLKRASEWPELERSGAPLWRMTFQDYLRWIEDARRSGRAETSLAKMLSHLRGFLDYAWRSGRCERNVLDGFRLQDGRRQSVPRVLSVAEALRLVKCCPQDTAVERRDRTMVLLLYGCGLRTAELCDLRVQDVHRDRKELFIRAGKGDRERAVPIPKAVFMELLGYLLERSGKCGPLFRTAAKRCGISTKDVCNVVRLAAQRAGIDWKVTPKTLRHSYATHLMDRGVDLAVISSLMGHRSPTETGVYLHVLEGRPRSAVDRLHGQDGKG